jgi:hypothetical protein
MHLFRFQVINLHLKLKHKSRIIISNNSKIMRNSPEVNMSIVRLNPEVGHKNIFRYGYKNRRAKDDADEASSSSLRKKSPGKDAGDQTRPRKVS